MSVFCTFNESDNTDSDAPIDSLSWNRFANSSAVDMLDLRRKRGSRPSTIQPGFQLLDLIGSLQSAQGSGRFRLTVGLTLTRLMGSPVGPLTFLRAL